MAVTPTEELTFECVRKVNMVTCKRETCVMLSPKTVVDSDCKYCVHMIKGIRNEERSGPLSTVAEVQTWLANYTAIAGDPEPG